MTNASSRDAGEGGGGGGMSSEYLSAVRQEYFDGWKWPGQQHVYTH